MSLRAVRLFTIVCFAAGTVFGQAVTSLTGSVGDPTGAAIPGAAITLTNTETNAVREQSTDEAGRYSFSGLQPGPYKLRASKTGFADISVIVEKTLGRYQPPAPQRVDDVLIVDGEARRIATELLESAYA